MRNPERAAKVLGVPIDDVYRTIGRLQTENFHPEDLAKHLGVSFGRLLLVFKVEDISVGDGITAAFWELIGFTHGGKHERRN